MTTVASEILAAAFIVTDEIGLQIDPSGLPEFSDTTLAAEQVSASLVEAISPALSAHAELLGSGPVINAMRSTHVQRAQGMIERAKVESAVAFERTLRAAPKATALTTAAGNEIDASIQLGGAVASMTIDLSIAYQNMDVVLEALDQQAPLVGPEADSINWKVVARGAISLFLSSEE